MSYRDSTFEKYTGQDGDWYWRLWKNYNNIARSSEGYTSEAACDRSIQIVMDTNRSTPVIKKG